MAEAMMQDNAEPPPAGPAAPGLRSLTIDAGLPWLALQVLERVGVPTIWALAAAAVFPAYGLFSAWRRARSFDVVGAIVLASLGIGLIVALSLGDARFALVKAAPAFALFGAACLASLPRPLMFFVARYFAPGDPAVKVTDWDQRLSRPMFRRAMFRLTLVWGFACLIEASLGIATAFLLPLHIAVVAEPLLAISTITLLLAWTRWFARRRAQLAAQAMPA
jgi:hypothetical protein